MPDDLAAEAITADPSPEGNPALAAAVEAIVRRQLAATHCNACEDAARTRILLDALPDAAAALEAAAPAIRAEAVAAERERLAAVLEAILARSSDAEFEKRLEAIRDRKPLHDAIEKGPGNEQP